MTTTRYTLTLTELQRDELREIVVREIITARDLCAKAKPNSKARESFSQRYLAAHDLLILLITAPF